MNKKNRTILKIVGILAAILFIVSAASSVSAADAGLDSEFDSADDDDDKKYSDKLVYPPIPPTIEITLRI